MSVTEQIAHFTTHFSLDEMTAEQHEKATAILKLSILDWCTVGIAGIDQPVSELVKHLALRDGGREECAVFGSKQKLPAKAAALVNGVTSHALDYDDTHFLHVGHISVAVLPAALAIAEANSASGEEFLTAALIGSEVSCHLGHWLGRSHYQSGFHQTATAGTFGATAAACKILKLSHQQTVHALGFAATRASGLVSQFGTMSKPYHAGMAASNGVEAALLAANGFTAREDGIECPGGFADTHFAETSRPLNLDASLGKQFVFSDVQHKLHACCHGLHASIEALKVLQADHHLNIGNIDAITIKTNPRWLKVCNIDNPKTALESKFSYRHSSALVFSDYDTAALSTYSDACCQDTSLHKIRESTSIIADEALADTASTVHIKTEDGSEFEASYDLADSFPTSIRTEKVLEKSRVLLGNTHSSQLWSTVQNTERLAVMDSAYYLASAPS